jgi:hypothetical protein
MVKTKALFLLAALLLFNCGPDDPAPNYKELVPVDRSVQQGQLVQLSDKTLVLETDQYEGKFGEISIGLGKANDSTLVFMVPVGAEVGDTKLTIADLSMTVSYKVEKVTLSGSVESVIAEASKGFETALATFPDDAPPSAQQAFNVFTQLLQEATDEEKNEFAVFYESNKEAFTNLLSISSPGFGAGRIAEISNLKKFQLSVAFLGAGVWSFYASITASKIPGQQGVALIAGAASVTVIIIAFEKAKEYGNKLKDEQLNVVQIVIRDIIGFVGGRTSSQFSINENIQAILSIDMDLRGLINSDRSSHSTAIQSFFSVLDELNDKIIGGINETIGIINDYSPFADIDPVNELSIPTQVTPSTVQINTEELASPISFYIGDDRIAIKEKKFENNKLVLTLATTKIVNPANDITAMLAFTYVDDYNNYTSENEITFLPAPLALDFVTTDPSIQQAEEKQLIVKVIRSEEAVPNATIAFTVQSGDAVLSSSSVVTGADGTATVTVKQTGTTAPIIKVTLQDYQFGAVVEKTFTYTNSNTITWVGVWDLIYQASDDNENGVIDTDEEMYAGRWYQRTEDCHGTFHDYETTFESVFTFSGAETSGDMVWSEESEFRGWDEGNQCGGENGIETEQHQQKWSYDAASNRITIVSEDRDDPGAFYSYDYNITIQGSTITLTTMDDGELEVLKLIKRP